MLMFSIVYEGLFCIIHYLECIINMQVGLSHNKYTLKSVWLKRNSSYMVYIMYHITSWLIIPVQWV